MSESMAASVLAALIFCGIVFGFWHYGIQKHDLPWKKQEKSPVKPPVKSAQKKK